jgi:hypothetical protein
MNRVFISKNGFRAIEWDGNVGSYVDTPIVNILNALRVECYIEDGVTLRDIMEAVGGNEILAIIIGGYAWCDVAAFVREAAKPKVRTSPLKYIEICATWHISEPENGQLPDMRLLVDVHGRDDSDMPFGIDFTPVNELCRPARKAKPECRSQ